MKKTASVVFCMQGSVSIGSLCRLHFENATLQESENTCANTGAIPEVYFMLFRKTKRTTAFLLALLTLAMACLALVSCGDKNATVLSLDGVEFNEKAYAYWYTELKNYYVSSYSDIQDTEECWKTEISDLGITYGEFVDDKIRTQIRYYLAGNSLFKELGLSVPQSVTSTIDENIEDAINSFGSRSAYDKYLDKKYGINSKEYRAIKLMEQKYYLVYSHLYDSQTGTDLATAEEIDLFYQENYAHIKYYMVRKNFDYEYDKDGNKVLDSSGKYVLVELTDEQKAANRKKIEEIYAKVKDGESLDSYIQKDFPDEAKNYPNGYYVLQNEYYGYLFTSTVINAAFELTIGESVFCENEDAYFIVQRLSLPDKAYQESDKDQFSDIGDYAVSDKFEARFAEVMKNIVANETLVEKYSVLTVD